MEKMNCNVVYDLLPLYLDGLCSEESNQMVETHIKECERCSKTLERMRQDVKLPEDKDVEVIKKVKRRIQIEKAVIAFVIVFVLVNAILIGGSYMLAHQLPMNDLINASNVRVQEDANGDIWLVRSGHAVYASHVIGELYTEDGRLIIGSGEPEVTDYEGERVVDVVIHESLMSRLTYQVFGDMSSIEEEKSLLFNANDKPERCKVTINLAEGEVVLWERN